MSAQSAALDEQSAQLILVVDDEQINRTILESSLCKHGFQTLSAASGQECLEKAEEHKPDLILLDIMMPGLDGWHTCQSLKSNPETKDIPVIFLSALTDAQQKNKGFASGGVDYVNKPFDISELLARVRIHLTLRSQEVQLRQYADSLQDMVEQRTSQLKEAEQELQRNYDMQTALNQLLHLALQDMPLESLLQQCLENILQSPLLSLRNQGCIYLRDEKGQKFSMAAAYNLPPSVLEHCSTIVPGVCVCGRAIEQEAILLAREHDLDRKYAEHLAVPHNHLCVPIKSKNTLLALLNLFVDKDRWPSEREKEFLQAVANTLMQMILYKRSEERMLHHAFHDALTDLPNRAALLERLETEAQKLQNSPKSQFALILFNLDRLNSYNESFGFELGDKIILSTASRLIADCRSNEEVLHLGGDEFALLLKNLQNNHSPLQRAEDVLEKVKEPHQLDSHLLQITACAGVVLSEVQFAKGQDILRYADTAVHQAKNQGQNKLEIFNEDMHHKTRQAMQTFLDLRQALEREEFVLFYQPIICLETGRGVGVEALVRWQHPTRGMVSPGEFIPIVEDTGLILPLGRWILDKAFSDMKQFCAQRQLAAPVTLSVNISGKQFAQKDFFEQIEVMLQRTDFEPHLVKLEITESVVMENAEAAAQILEQLKQLKIQISIDDFGTGYSSLSYLHSFPVDIIKVDRTFVRGVQFGGENLEIVRTIITLAHALNMQVVAEGVETEEEVHILKKMGCEYVQGFYFARPMPLADLQDCTLFCR